MAASELVEELARLDLADTTRGGIHGAVETTHTGHPATITPIRSAA